MIEIKFRAKRIDNNQWVYGDYYRASGLDYIITNHSNNEDDFDNYEVYDKTLGQFTGLKDYLNKDIYEGDIVKFTGRTCSFLYKGYCQKPFESGQIFIVKCIPSGYSLTDPKIKDSVIPNQIGHVHNYEFWNNAKSLDIIGNIHDNKELLN